MVKVTLIVFGARKDTKHQYHPGRRFKWVRHNRQLISNASIKNLPLLLRHLIKFNYPRATKQRDDTKLIRYS